MRVVGHLVVLVVICTSVWVSGSAATPKSRGAVAPATAADASNSVPSWLQLPASTALEGSRPRATQGPTQGADQSVAAVVNPGLALPMWVRTVQDSPLWSSADPGATTLGQLAGQTSYLKPLGPLSGGRIEVYFPGDGLAQAATQAWVDLSAIEPTTVPPWVATPLAQQTTSSLLLPAPPQRISDADPPFVSAEHVAIIDEASGALLYGDKPFTQVPQASTTKIATTIVALERAPDLGQRIRVSVSATQMAVRDGSSTMGLEPGEVVSLGTLLYGMMLPSGNDAAEQVAVTLAPSRSEFVGWMNQEAQALGLKDTHFANPTGMDAADHYSSAYDMAMLARYAMRNATFRRLASTTRYVGDDYVLTNINRLLSSYPGADGVKVGYTDAAQKTIVASATRDGHRVYIGLMHSQDLVYDGSLLFDWVWNSFRW